MSVTIVLGSQFGDEAKGKLVDYLLHSGRYDLVCRCAGGHNAGHTLVVNGVSFDFHILPSGLVSPKAINLIGNGVVVHIPQFFKELNNLKSKGVDTDGRIFISDRAHVLFQLHKLVDGLQEKALGKLFIGTTGNGIGPCYSDKHARSGIRISEIMDKTYFDQRLRALAKRYQDQYGDVLRYDTEKEIQDFDEYRQSLKPYVVDSLDMVHKTQAANQNILVEAANALCLDIDAGTFPYVTSSNTGVAGVMTGLMGIHPESLTNRIGVVKAYTSKVGSGPFPSEDTGEYGEKLQRIGREFGTTTGRKRQCGPLDLVMLRHTNLVNRYTAFNFTKMDVLDTFPIIKVAVAYHCTDDVGNVSVWKDHLPADLRLLQPDRCRIEHTELKGWMTDISKCRVWNDLPKEAKEYVEWVEKEMGAPIKWVGVGPDREAMIVRG